MGKRPKTKRGEQRAIGRKVDKSIIPPPPPPLEEEIGSAQLLPEPKVPGSRFKVLNSEKEGYDDGGVGDLTLLIDLEDRVLRRKRGDNAYFQAVRSDVLPRLTTGPMAGMSRREQKVELAKLLFSEGDLKTEDDEDSDTPSEVYFETNTNTQDDDPDLKRRRKTRLDKSKRSLRLSIYLCEQACAAIALTEISKRILLLNGKEGAESALRVADKALAIASNGFYDNDLIAIEADDEPKDNPKYVENATTPGLSNPVNLKYYPIRTSQLIQRAGFLHRGNALMALGRYEDARESFQGALPLMEMETRCCRVDWERSSVLVNIGNTYTAQGNFEKANEFFDQAEKLGAEHVEAEDGNKLEGMGIQMIAMKARSFSMRKAGKEEEAKALLREALKLQVEFNENMAKDKKIMQTELEQKQLEAVTGQEAAANNEDPSEAADASKSVEAAA